VDGRRVMRTRKKHAKERRGFRQVGEFLQTGGRETLQGGEVSEKKTLALGGGEKGSPKKGTLTAGIEGSRSIFSQRRKSQGIGVLGKKRILGGKFKKDALRRP